MPINQKLLLLLVSNLAQSGLAWVFLRSAAQRVLSQLVHVFLLQL